MPATTVKISRQGQKRRSFDIEALGTLMPGVDFSVSEEQQAGAVRRMVISSNVASS